MDEAFKYFLDNQGFGPAIGKQVVSEASIARFRQRLPERLLQYWGEHGWSGYGAGRFWIVDPDQYEPALEAWIGDTPLMEKDAYYVIARSGFGDLFLWGTRTGRSLRIRSLWGMIFPKDDAEAVKAGRGNELVESFVAFQQKADLDQKDDTGQPLFERAAKTLGQLAADEMYAFEPALALGGKADLQHLRKVKCVEHLVMLAQLGERRIMRDIVADAKAQGLM